MSSRIVRLRRITQSLICVLMPAITVLMAVNLGDTREVSLTKSESFDRDPEWDGHNNRSPVPRPRDIRQGFGYSQTSHAGGEAGEAGGFITPVAEPAYYAKIIPQKSFDSLLVASGKLRVAIGGNRDDGAGNTLIGFFNSRSLNEWRTPNTIALRVNGRGEVFHAHVEYATSLWRAGGDFPGEVDQTTGRKKIHEFPSDKVYEWSLRYDPDGNNGGGTLTGTVGDKTTIVNLDAGHKADGATFDRFGLLNVMKHADGGGSVWIDNTVINSESESFDRDPGWEGFQNRRVYTSEDVRPRFNFGFILTRFAGGRAPGELGGLIFRGDERYPERMAYYGDRLKDLTLFNPLKASGRVCMRRGVTDSTTLFGFFHSKESMMLSQAQTNGLPENFLGVAIEGPSTEGFLFYPVYSTGGEAHGGSPRAGSSPRIYPDGKSHAWTLEYVPGDNGTISVSLDGKSTIIELSPGHKAIGARFDRFGIVTTHIDGNGQWIYLDDLTYTWKAM